MNKKGFTTIELIVSFIMVVVILTSLIGFTTAYRGKVNDEEVKSQLFDFKNTILKTVYDDIIRYSVVRMSECVGEDNCVNFIGNDESVHTLKTQIIYCDDNNCDKKNDGTYIIYDGTKYLLPDSNLNKVYYEKIIDELGNEVKIPQSTDSACNITDFKYTNYQNKIFTVKITFKHYLIDEEYDILITLN